MKHYLLAASVLAMTAGVAAADVTFTSSATIGIANNGTGNSGEGDPNGTGILNNSYHVYSSFTIVAEATGQTDSGLTFGATFDLTAGPTYALADDDGFDHWAGGVGGSTSASFGEATVYLNGQFGRLSFSYNNIDFYNSDVSQGGALSNDGDFKYEGTMAGFGYGLIADVESGDMSAMLSYNLFGFALYGDYNMDSTTGWEDIWDVTLGYNLMGFLISVGVNNDNNTSGGSQAIDGTVTTTTVGTYDVSEDIRIGYQLAGIDTYLQYNQNHSGDSTIDPSFDLGATWTSGATSISLVVDNVSDAHIHPDDRGPEWTLTGSYDLGGGLVIEAGANYTGDMMLGAKMAF